MTEFFEPLDLETVRVAVPSGIDWREARFRRPQLDQGDVEAVARECPAVRSATRVTSDMLRTEGDSGAVLLMAYAVGPDFTQTLPDALKEGRLFTAEEAEGLAPVCVLSSEARVMLFGEGPVLDRSVRLEGRRIEVIGVIAGNRHSGIETRAVYLPTAPTRAVPSVLRGNSVTECFARTDDPKAAVGQIEELMRQRLGGDGSRPFTHSLWRVREAALHARSRASAYSVLAGLCALLAAGLGIASLLFVSVAERTREIGVQRALGASRLCVYGEHLLAAVLLSGGGALIGGLAAIPASAAGAFATRWQPVLDPLAGATATAGGRGLPQLGQVALSVSWQAMAMAVVLALLVGAMAALTPASEAASLSPALAIAQRASAQRGLRQALTCIQVAFGVIVLVVLTSYFALIESEEKAEARLALGQDRVFAAADPVSALREPVDQRYADACRDALAAAFGTPEALAQLQQRTPLLTDVAVSVPLPLDAEHAGVTLEHASVTFTTAAAFGYNPPLVGEVGERVMQAFRAGRPVAVITSEVRNRLFGQHGPVGESLRIAGREFTVAGVRPDPPEGLGTQGILVPITHYAALRARAPREAEPEESAYVEGRPVDERRYAEALAQLREALLPMLPQEYRKSIVLSDYIPETTKQFIFQSKAVAARGAVGALAVLLVALIGLANMLLVSVHDELRETGVRRAFGATRPDVFLHFLSQGVVLSALGAIAGLAIGGAVCAATRSWAGMPLSVSAFWAGAGAVATVLAGTLTSVAPALLASRIHPVEALRYE